MGVETKKRIIVISIIDLLFAILFALNFFIFLFFIPSEILTGYEYIIALIFCGAINSFLIRDATLKEHIKFFIPFSIGIAILFKIVYIYSFFEEVNFLNYIISSIMKFAVIFFIGTLLGAALKKIMNKMDEHARKKLIIRLIVYSIVSLIAFIILRFTWLLYAEDHPDQALKMHIFFLKLQGIEYCETPEEAIQRYADALIRGDRREAMKYIIKRISDKGWEYEKKRLYSKTNKELKEEGEELLGGFFDYNFEKSIAEWDVKTNSEAAFALQLFYDKEQGWKIE